MAYEHSYPVLIKEAHVDSLGHMNNATYLQLFEEARWDLITARGYGFHKVQELQQGPVILEVNVKFLAELGLRDQITIKTVMEDYQGKIGKLKQQMIREDGKIASEAIFVVGLFDLKLRKLILPTDAWKKAVGVE